jgi:quinol monooxygenase YgiN
MFMRLLQVKIKPEQLAALGSLYERRIIPALQGAGGCVYACLLQRAHRPEEGLSMTLWRSEADSQKYERSGLFMQLVAEARPFFADTKEWKLQLSRDFNLEYASEPEEPTVKTFSVSTTSGQIIPSKENAPHAFLRIVSLHIRSGKMEEYAKLYERDIIPTLLSTHGCQFSCLSTPTTDSNEAISVTLWKSRADAVKYEQSGTFDQLLQSVKHTLSDLSQLKMESAGTRLPSVTSEDMDIEGFQLVVGKNLMI